MQTIEIVQRAIDFIEERLDEPLELEQIAMAAAMSVPNLYRMFYSMTGHPVKEYIRKRRTSEAAFLLRSTEVPAIDIGFRCGFDSYQTFIKAFKRHTGLTPGLYRRTGLIFSFERINLNEGVAYLEEWEVSERFPGVKVIQLTCLKGLGYLHTADSEKGLEDEALVKFRLHLKNNGIDPRQTRLFGWNVDLDQGSRRFGYQLAAVSEKEFLACPPNLTPIAISGGLYAVTRTPAGSGEVIAAAWNRLLAEWLPRSTFELGEHGLLEEYQQYGDQISRLKLYLPVRREQEATTIEIVERPSVEVISFRAEGGDCVTHADNESVNWLSRSGFAGDSRLQLFMSCSFPPSENSIYEIYIALPEGVVPSHEDIPKMTRLEGGLYACLTTGPCGLMTGVLERIYRWIGSCSDYEPDENRRWYARYTDFGERVSVKCCVPIILRI